MKNKGLLGETEEKREDFCEGSLCLPQDPTAVQMVVSTPNSEVI